MATTRILVVHRHTFIANVLSRILAADGCEVMVASTVGSGLALLSHHQPNFVLVGPQIATMEQCAFVKACFRLDLQPITVVVLEAPQAMKPTLKELGVAGFLDIPFSLEALRNWLDPGLAREK
jgi:DNA-binding NtrC family response regulator